MNDFWEVLLIKHHAGHWSFPKGRPEGDTFPSKTAERELLEETGLKVKEFLREQPFVENYTFTRDGILIKKRVEYFPAVVEGRVVIQKEEISDFKWTPLSLASAKATFLEAKNLCKEVEKWLVAL